MSHLITIIERVALGKGKDEQDVINLMEYIRDNKDWCAEEKEQAFILFAEYEKNCKGNQAPSHKARLKQARNFFYKCAGVVE